MDKESIDIAKIKSIIEKRLLRAPKEMKRFFPPILLNPEVKTFCFPTDTYFIIDLVDSNELKRINDLKSMGYHPFPGLIKPNDVTMPVAITLEKSRNGLIDHNKVENTFSLKLGKDCTLILWNHTQSVKIKELGTYEYTIKLAYVISFGDEINRYNLYDYLEDLIAYSIKQWRSINGG